MMEWTTQHDREFAEYFPVPDQELQEKRRQVVFDDSDRGLTWIGLGLALLVGSTFWAMLAVFCWGGNLLPRW